MFQDDKKPFTSDHEQHYYRVSLTLAGLFYVVQYLTEKSSETTLEFLIPRIVMGIIPILLASLSFVPGLLRNKLQDLSAGYFMIASLHVLGLLSINDSGPGDIFIIFGIIFFTNLQLTRMLQIVIYNITMLASIEFVFISSGFGSGIDPVAFFLMLVLVILMCGAYQIFRIRSAGTGKDREHLLSELVSGNPDAWIVFEGNGLIAREAGSRAMELFGLNDTNALRTFSLRNIITAGSPFEADKIISSILAGERVEQKTMCRKPSGEFFWAEIAVFRISVKDNDYFCRFIDISEYLNSKEIANATAIRYRSYLDNINEGLIIADQHLKVILANRCAGELTGISQVNGHSLGQMFREEVMMRLRNLVTSTESSPVPFETLTELKNGQKIKVTVSVETEPIDQTRELVILLRKDITELQEPSDQGTPEEWKNFLSVLGKGQIPACAINQKGHFILCNRAFSQTTGYGPGDLSLLTLDNIVHPSDTDKVALILKGLASKAVEIHLLDGEGRDIWVKVSASAIPAEGLTLLILEDITDLILTRQELQRSGSRIGALIENTQSPVALIDFNHRLTYFNNAFRNEFRKRTGRNAVNGEDYRSLLQDQALERWETAYNKLISGERYFEDEQVQYTDGSKAWFESSCTPVKDQSGAVTGISLFMRNVTDRITFQNDLIQARNQAEAATKAKSGFLATMSHEIRTPLNGLLGMAELLTGTALNNEQKSYLDSIRVSGEALLSIINDVLDYSKIESEMMTLEQKPFSISGTIRETFDMLRYRADEKGNTLSSKTESSLPDIITGDKVRLRQVLLNLTGNAIKFTQNGNIAIDVRMLEQTGDLLTAEFTVSDTGIGIPPDKMDKLFKSFSQADESTFSQYGGTGLGLAISARLVSLMGGTIRAESIHGKGSKFIFTIKTKAAAILPAEQVSPSQKTTTTSAIKLNILVAEDNAVNQQVALAMISKMGHAVTLVNNGKEAVEAAMTGKFPVIFIDVQMPVLDGLEATRQIRQRLTGASQPFIVAMTAQALEGDREACLAAGMDDYIAKPVTASAFADKIRSYIKSEKSGTAAETLADTGAALLDFGIIDKLRALGDDDNAFMSKIIQLYQDQSAETMEEIKRNADAGDMKLLYQSAHKLKGASLNLGAKETGEWCRKLEEASKASDIATCREIIPPLERTFAETIDALKKLI